jgi:hypothetical protein
MATFKADLFRPPQDPNHYELFSLDETASSWEIWQAYRHGPSTWPPGPWRWSFFHNPRLVAKLDARCHEAYAAIGDPKKRLEYDEQQGVTRRSLARRIGRKGATWGIVWLLLFVALAAPLFGGQDNLPRMLGSAFAPDFHEHIELVRNDLGGTRYESTFISSNEMWQRALNDRTVVGVLPGMLSLLVGIGGGIGLNRVAGWIVARVRFAGYRDVWARSLIWVATLGIPALVLLQILRFGSGSVATTTY